QYGNEERFGGGVPDRCIAAYDLGLGIPGTVLGPDIRRREEHNRGLPLPVAGAIDRLQLFVIERAAEWMVARPEHAVSGGDRGRDVDRSGDGEDGVVAVSGQLRPLFLHRPRAVIPIPSDGRGGDAFDSAVRDRGGMAGVTDFARRGGRGGA